MKWWLFNGYEIVNLDSFKSIKLVENGKYLHSIVGVDINDHGHILIDDLDLHKAQTLFSNIIEFLDVKYY